MMDDLFHELESDNTFFGLQIPIRSDNKEQLQRTEEWFNKRKGRFTGSEMKKLMACSRSTSKLEWGRDEKILDFSEIAIKYVFAKAKERQRNKIIHGISSKQMDFGKKFEDQVKDLLRQRYGYIVEDCDFIEFLEGIAGSSPDGKVDYNKGLEIKMSTSWDTLFSRHECVFDESHQDFWQIQSEMLSLQTDQLLYVVAEPIEDIMNPPEILNTDLSIMEVEASKVHQYSMIHRCKIGDEAIKLYLQGIPIRDAIIYSCTNYKFN